MRPPKLKSFAVGLSFAFVAASPIALALAAGAPGPAIAIVADPPPLVAREQWVFDLRFDDRGVAGRGGGGDGDGGAVAGDVFLIGVQKIDLGAPKETARVLGRFAIELFDGATLIERVRFDFPLLGGASPTSDGGRWIPRFDRRISSRVGVVFPVTPRGTRLELWDRATDRRWPLPWPPVASPPAPPSAAPSAGAPR